MYYYETCCVSSTARAIDSMVDQAKEVTLATVRRNCPGLQEWETQMGYDTGHERGGLRLKDDWHVRYYKSKYKSRPCYYIVHSAIEHIWTEQ